MIEPKVYSDTFCLLDPMKIWHKNTWTNQKTSMFNEYTSHVLSKHYKFS